MWAHKHTQLWKCGSVHANAHAWGQETAVVVSLHFPTCVREGFVDAHWCVQEVSCSASFLGCFWFTEVPDARHYIWLYLCSEKSTSGLHLASQMLYLLSHLPSSGLCFRQYISYRLSFLSLWVRPMIRAYKFLIDLWNLGPPLTRVH